MGDRYSRKVWLIIIAGAFVCPILVMLWRVQIGIILLFMGLLVIWRASRFMRVEQYYGSVEDQKALHYQSNQGRTIYVQLVDDDGNDLDPSIAQQRLAAAQNAAGPRDTVMGVRYKASSNSKAA